MNDQHTSLEAIQDIRRMMERSSRFISLSGLSGIAAGICALIGAWFAYQVIDRNGGASGRLRILEEGYESGSLLDLKSFMGSALFIIALFTFLAALVLAFVFTYYRSRKHNIPIWGSTAKKLMVNVSIPMLVGGIFLLRMIQLGSFGLIAPGCLIFYGLALVNASKYTLGEVRYLGYALTLLGLINCWHIGYGLFFWAAGFGVLHIIYGGWMWWKYERTA